MRYLSWSGRGGDIRRLCQVAAFVTISKELCNIRCAKDTSPQRGPSPRNDCYDCIEVQIVRQVPMHKQKIWFIIICPTKTYDTFWIMHNLPFRPPPVFLPLLVHNLYRPFFCDVTTAFFCSLLTTRVHNRLIPFVYPLNPKQKVSL